MLASINMSRHALDGSFQKADEQTFIRRAK